MWLSYSKTYMQSDSCLNANKLQLSMIKVKANQVVIYVNFACFGLNFRVFGSFTLELWISINGV